MVGTIADKLQAVLDSKAAIKAAIIAKGGSAGDVLSQYASAIENLPSGGDFNEQLYNALTQGFDLVIPDSVTNLNSNEFQYTKVKSVVGNNVKNIWNDTFYNCSMLETVSFPSLKNLGGRTFAGTKISSINLPDTVTSIGDWGTFLKCTYLTDLTYPPLVTIIHTQNQDGCTALVTFEAKGDITAIETFAFNNCTSLTTFTLSGVTSVPSLASNAFNGCSALAHIRVPSGLVDAFKAASGWSDYASIIEAI